MLVRTIEEKYMYSLYIGMFYMFYCDVLHGGMTFDTHDPNDMMN